MELRVWLWMLVWLFSGIASSVWAQQAAPKPKKPGAVSRVVPSGRVGAKPASRPVAKKPVNPTGGQSVLKPAAGPPPVPPAPTTVATPPPAQTVSQTPTYEQLYPAKPTKSVRQTASVNTAQQRDPETGNDPAFGLKGGLSLMTQTTNEQASNNKSWLIGYQGGLFLQIAGGNHFSLQPELNYVQKGIRYAYNSDYDQLTATYIDLPILAKFHIGTGRLTANVYTGPYVGYWLLGKLENQTDNQKLKLNYEFDSDKSDGYADNRLDYGAIGGVGLSFSTGSGYILLEGRYQYGLADIANLNPKPDGYTPTYNRGFQASIGYAIKF